MNAKDTANRLQCPLDGGNFLRSIHAADAKGFLDGSGRNWGALLRVLRMVVMIAALSVPVLAHVEHSFRGQRPVAHQS